MVHWRREITNPGKPTPDFVIGQLMVRMKELEDRVAYIEEYGIPKPKPSIVPTVKTGTTALIVSAIVAGITQGLAQLLR